MSLLNESRPAPASARPKPETNWRRSMLVGYALIFGGLGSFSAWASFARLDAAAIAPGIVTAESNRKTLQHLEGGIIREILVRDGDRVKRDQVLIRLDPTRIDTQGDLYSNQIAILVAQEARLLAEYEGRDTLTFPADVIDRQRDAAVAPVIADQNRLFASRRAAIQRNTQVAQAQIEQARKDIEQVEVDTATARLTLEQVEAELSALRPLYAKQLVPTTRMAPLERERVRLRGILEGAPIQTARLREKLDEAMLRRQQVQQDYRQEASTQLAEIRKLLNDARQQRLLVSDSQRRTDIVAPLDGTVQQMRVFTVGGVLRPGEPILDIAPENDELVIKAKVHPNDADRVGVGQAAEVRFPSFGYWGAGQIKGRVRSVSRDRIVEEQGREQYFAAEVVVDKATVPPQILDKLSAGIGADVLISSGERTAMEYLLKPLTDHWTKGLRER